MRIGVGGSAANPPHWGHVELMKKLLDSGKFDKLIWIPSGVRPDKSGAIEAKHRKKMTELMLEYVGKGDGKTELVMDYTDVEGTNTPTIRWLERLQWQNPGADIVWYTGSDSVIAEEKYGGKNEIEAVWCEGEDLLAKWKFLVITRDGFELSKEDEEWVELEDNLELMEMNLPDIASSEIRKRIKEGESISGLLPEKIEKYIKENNLYR